MTVYQKVRMPAQGYAEVFACGHALTFQDRKLRDEVARLIRKQRIKLKLRSSRGQETHPEYVDDYEGTIESGFGNTMYKTYFPHLYHIEQVR